MSPSLQFGWSRFGLPTLIVFALLLAAAVANLRWGSARRPPLVDARSLAAGPEANLGRQVVVIGEWRAAGPIAKGYMVVVLRGRDGGDVSCHFEDVPAADAAGLVKRLVRPLVLFQEVAVLGRCDGVEDGRPVLRGCRLLD